MNRQVTTRLAGQVCGIRCGKQWLQPGEIQGAQSTAQHQFGTIPAPLGLQIQAAGSPWPIQPRGRCEALAGDLHRPTTGQLELLARRRQTDSGRLIQFKAQVQIRGCITALGNFTELPVTTIRLAIQDSIKTLQPQP